MDSAFGVDHGDIEKAFGASFKMPKLGGAGGAHKGLKPPGNLKPLAEKAKLNAGDFTQKAKGFGMGAKQGMAGRQGPAAGYANDKGLRFGQAARNNRKAIGIGAAGIAGGGAAGYSMNSGRNRNGQIK